MSDEQLTEEKTVSTGVKHLVEQFNHLPDNIQRLLIGIAFLTLLSSIAVIRNKIEEAWKAKSAEAVE